MAKSYRTVHYGMGAIGAGILRAAVAKEHVRPVAALDVAPDVVGRDAGEVAGLDRPLGITISQDADATLATTAAEVVLHSTGSDLKRVHSQLLAAVRAGKNVISTCEELAYPWHRHPQLSAELDREAKEHGVTVLGTGVNPGFVMDTLALALTAVCQELSSITARRVVDVSTRRIQLQRKVGAGLSLDEFRRRANEGRIRHVGLEESLRLIAYGLGWQLDRVEETVEPALASAGVASGVHQVARGWIGGRDVLHLDLEMASGATDPRDEIVIEGKPPVSVVIRGGVQGDIATAAITVNAVPAVASARPGLLTMAELALVCGFNIPPPSRG
jgi:4-hydroxy-tetrahydrodipicolinate reductase